MGKSSSTSTHVQRQALKPTTNRNALKRGPKVKLTATPSKSPNASVQLLGIALASSLAGLLIIAVHIFQTNTAPVDAITRISVWAACSTLTLFIAHYLGHRPGVSKLIGHSNLRMFATSLVFSGVLLSTISVLINLPQSAFAAVNTRIGLQIQQAPPVEPVASFDTFKNGPPKFSEHYWTPPKPGAPLPHMQLFPEQSDDYSPFGERPETLEVENKKTAQKIVPAASKPDRSVKAEKPRRTSKPAKKKVRTKRNTKKASTAAKAKTSSVERKTSKDADTVAVTLLVQTPVPTGLNADKKVSCADRETARIAACRQEMGN